MLKYHAEIRFGYGQPPVRFTAVDLERLMARFVKEVKAEEIRRKEERSYSYIEPNLVVEICESWAEFARYEHTASV